jgi:hypothetical protein
MRALCGSIMAAGAFIGLGLAAIGVGMRYQYFSRDASGNPIELGWQHMDPALLGILVFLILAALTGIAVAFIGLMYHHHRRHHELLHMQSQLHAKAPQIQV